MPLGGARRRSQLHQPMLAIEQQRRHEAEAWMAMVPETRPSLLIRLRDPEDQSAWSTFLEIYEPLIYRLARQRRLQDADAREVAQEVLLAVAGAIHKWDEDPGRGSFRGWLTTITRNLVVNYLIKQSRHARGSGGTDFYLTLEGIPAHDSGESVRFELEEKRQIFRWAADRVRMEFSAKQWQAFWMTAIDGMTATSTANELQISIGLVYVVRNRIMKRLRETVEQFKPDLVRVRERESK